MPKLYEMFVSLQGEGLYMGCRQSFIRFAGCNLACAYCDTAGEGKDVILDDIQRFICGSAPFHSVAFTGGEPLLQADSLGRLASWAKGRGFPTYLETNGSLPDALKDVIQWIDIVSMDIKLPCVLGGRQLWSEHAAFIDAVLIAKKELFCKAVIVKDTPEEDILGLKHFLSQLGAKLPIILQPEHNWLSAYRNTALDKIQRIQHDLIYTGKDVRILPQMHKIFGLR